MKEKELMVLEYNPIQDSKHIYFPLEEKPSYNPEWLNFGTFYGTMLQASKELERRVKKYNAEKKLQLK